CAVAFKEKNNYVDLSGLGKVRFLTMIIGLHEVRLILKLADGTWLMSDQTIGPSSEYRVSELVLRDIRWRHLDVDYKIPAHVPDQYVYTSSVGEHEDGKWFDHPDLSRVDEIGWTDLTPGLGHGAGNGYSNVAWMEVY